MTSCSPADDTSTTSRDKSVTINSDHKMSVTEKDWAFWRGPTLNGKAAPSEKPPTEWSEEKNILWSYDIPGKGYSSPCIVQGKIYFSTSDEKKQTISLICLDQKSGKQLWIKDIYQGELRDIESAHRDSCVASTTPVSNGEALFFTYPTLDEAFLVALDLDGKELWKASLGPAKHKFIFSSSPGLWKNLVFGLNAGMNGAHFLIAFDQKSGKQAWKVTLPDNDTQETHASPVVLNVAGRDQLILAGPSNLFSYDPATGEQNWWYFIGSKTFVGMPAVHGKSVFASSGYNTHRMVRILAEATGGKNVTDTEYEEWNIKPRGFKAPYVPSILYHDGLLYGVEDETAHLACFDPETGKKIWESDQEEGHCYSSPMLADGKIYVFQDDSGLCRIYQPGRECKVLAENELDFGAYASPVFLDNKIYLRTNGKFYCIGK